MNIPEVSVLMSIYNESKREIKESIDSIINQTYHNFEIIIINDNPLRSDLADYIDSFADSRIRFYSNKVNIGLAMSMNYAASLARADIFARMDSDDIAYLERLEKEVQIIKNGGYDLVFSQFKCMDENSKILEGVFPIVYYDVVGMNRKLIDHDIIHHPTVLFRRSIFQRVGGYRNFPCAQDHDLWLRFIYDDAKIYMIKEPLLLYRKSNTSVSSRKWIEQQITIMYINELFLKRLEYGNDGYSYENYVRYIQRSIKSNTERQFMHAQQMLYKAKVKSNENYILSFIYRMFVFLSNTICRKNYIIKRKILKLYDFIESKDL